MHFKSAWGVAFSLCLMLLLAPSARASFHEWMIGEVYSNASGTVQFVEMEDGFDGEHLVNFQSLKSNGHTYQITNGNLNSTQTSGRHLLFATPGYFALSGVPAADYNLGINNFFNVNGDTLNWAFVNTFTFGAGELPTNNGNSLNRAYFASTITQALNSPTNFNRDTGTIPVPEPATAGLIACGLILLRRRRA